MWIAQPSPSVRTFGSTGWCMKLNTNNSYGLASVSGNADKIAAMQNEFEIVKKRMDDEAKKASRLEQKIKLLTQGYQARAGKLWSKVQDTFKQVDTAATELECFQELKKQEQMAASYRVRNLTEEVNNQKALEHTLQSRYGDLLFGYQRIQEQLCEHKRQLMIQEEIEAQNRAREEEIAAQNRAHEEEVAAQNCAQEGEVAAQNCAAEEEIGRIDHIAEEEVGQMNRTTDEEAVGSKQINEDQMDVDNSNVDGQFVGPNPPAPDTQGDNSVAVASVKQNASSSQSSNIATMDDGACDKIDASKLEGQDNTDDSVAVDTGNLEEGKNELSTVGSSIDEGNTAASSDHAVNNEEKDTVPG